MHIERKIEEYDNKSNMYVRCCEKSVTDMTEKICVRLGEKYVSDLAKHMCVRHAVYHVCIIWCIMRV